jgi:hypothetical protein
LSRLSEFQSQFQEMIFDPTPGATVSSWIEDDGLLEDRLNVYRNNVFYSLVGALVEFYPVVTRLVGEQFFRAMAAEYVRLSPPKSGRISECGQGFTEFVAGFEPAKKLPYLPDVVRLEWAWFEAYNAADAISMAPERLQEFPSERITEICFTLHPSSRLISSAYPIAKIWEANQPDVDDERVDLNSGGVGILVIRPDMDVEVRTLDLAGFVFVSSLVKGNCLGTAFEEALALDENLNLGGLLGSLLTGKTFTNAFID